MSVGTTTVQSHFALALMGGLVCASGVGYLVYKTSEPGTNNNTPAQQAGFVPASVTATISPAPVVTPTQAASETALGTTRTPLGATSVEVTPDNRRRVEVNPSDPLLPPRAYIPTPAPEPVSTPPSTVVADPLTPPLSSQSTLPPLPPIVTRPTQPTTEPPAPSSSTPTPQPAPVEPSTRPTNSSSSPLWEESEESTPTPIPTPTPRPSIAVEETTTSTTTEQPPTTPIVEDELPLVTPTTAAPSEER